MPPFLSGYNNRKKIEWGTVFPTSSNLTDFPKLFEITADADIAAALASGGGIAVTLADGVTAVPLGLYPETALASGTILMRSLFTILTAGTTGAAFGYLYFDASQTTTENKPGVVANNYTLFMPLEELPGGVAPQMLDWVTNTLVGTCANSGQSRVTGQVGDALNFNGSSDAVAIPTIPSAPFTVEVWANASSFSFSDASAIIANEVQGVSGLLLAAYQDAYWLLQVSGSSGGHNILASAALVTSTWVSLAALSDSLGNLNLYADASSIGTAASALMVAGAIPLSIGMWPSNGRYFNGIIDEVKISSVARTADWIGYAYQDESNNSATFSLGPLETNGGATTPGSGAGSANASIVVHNLVGAGGAASVHASIVVHNLTGAEGVTSAHAVVVVSSNAKSLFESFSAHVSLIASSLKQGEATSAAHASFVIHNSTGAEGAASAHATIAVHNISTGSISTIAHATYVASSVKATEGVATALASLSASSLRSGFGGLGASAIASNGIQEAGSANSFAQATLVVSHNLVSSFGLASAHAIVLASNAQAVEGTAAAHAVVIVHNKATTEAALSAHAVLLASSLRDSSGSLGASVFVHAGSIAFGEATTSIHATVIANQIKMAVAALGAHAVVAASSIYHARAGVLGLGSVYSATIYATGGIGARAFVRKGLSVVQWNQPLPFSTVLYNQPGPNAPVIWNQ